MKIDAVFPPVLAESTNAYPSPNYKGPNDDRALATVNIPSGANSTIDYSGRIAQAEKIVAQDPKNLNAWISLGNDYFDTEQSQKAIHAYGKALEIDPNNPNLLTDQGVMYRNIRLYSKALENFEKALNINPNHLQCLYNTGVVYAVDLKDNVKAQQYWLKYLEIDSTSVTATEIKNILQNRR